MTTFSHRTALPAIISPRIHTLQDMAASNHGVSLKVEGGQPAGGEHSFAAGAMAIPIQLFHSHKRMSDTHPIGPVSVVLG